MWLTVPGCSGRVARSLQLRLTLLDLGGNLGVAEWVRGKGTATRVSLRHIGVALTSGGSAEVAEGDLGLTSSARGLRVCGPDPARSLHSCRDLGVSGLEVSEWSV